MLRGTLALDPDARRRLEQLFSACDTRGEGSIGREALLDLCSSLGLGADESDALFTDLDCDGDGRIDFNDFVAGFREFVCPPVPSSPVANGVSNGPDYTGHGNGPRNPPLTAEESEQRRKEAVAAWGDFLEQLSNSANHVVSKERIKELDRALRSSSSSPQMIMCFEQVFRGLITDVQRLQDENSRLEQTYKKERESHEHHLHQLEEEMDIQVQHLEHQIKQQAREEAELERKALKCQMDAELAELHTHLKLFQSFDNWLKKDRADDTERARRIQGKLEEVSQENRHLRLSLADTQTNMALLRGELAQLRAHYEDKCKQLHQEKEVIVEYLHEQDHLTRQLHLLHEANKRLQDMNDTLRTSQDSAVFLQKLQNLRRPSAGFLARGSVLGDYLPQEKGSQGDLSDTDSVFLSRKRLALKGPSPPSLVEVDAESEHSMKIPLALQTEEMTFGIKRLMEDLDSGLSTLRDENESILDDEDKIKGHEQLISPNSSKDEETLTTTVENSSLYSSPFVAPGPTLLPSTGPSMESLASVAPSSLRHPLASETSEHFSASLLSQHDPTGPPERTYKVVFAGDAAVGKSSFILRIVKENFIPTISSTLGVDFHVKTLRVDDLNVTLQLWDTAGQERFRSITKSYFRRADGVMLLYDCTNEKSFLNVRHWMESIDEVLEKNLPIMLCCNKTDLRDTALAQGRNCVPREIGEKLAREYGAIFMETSAKDGRNVLDAILQLTRQMSANEDLEVRISTIEVGKTETKKKNCCK